MKYLKIEDISIENNKLEKLQKYISKRKVVAVAGHRPNHLGGYSNDVHKLLVKTAKRALKKVKPDVIITGMTLGWGQAVAEACIKLNIPFIAAIPNKDFGKSWSESFVARYLDLLSRAKYVYLAYSKPYSFFTIANRNMWMVDNANKLLACWNEELLKGDTYETVEYCKKVNKPIENVYSIFKKLQEKGTVNG